MAFHKDLNEQSLGWVCPLGVGECDRGIALRHRALGVRTDTAE